nr:hypothetical protein [Acidobacteriota bacterium]NIQ84725.1 hypothetical protein [Acidobacteriota bacterium]
MATTASNGTIECTGTIRGNNLGFPDAHDFTPDRADPSTRRVAVFGDSYTAGYYVPRSWPDLAEVAAPHIDFMNFAVDGGGLVNWWSVITRLVAPQEYELDAVIFAVFGDDLFREFSVYDDGYEAVDGRQVQFARVPLAPGRGLPASRSEARRHLQPVDRFHRVSPERFDALLRGEWRPRSTRSVRPFFAARALELLRSTGGPEAGVAAGRRFQAVHYEMMEEIRAALAPRGVPMLAVYVPWRDELTGGPARYGSADEVRRFAERIGADFLDGTGAFEDLDEDELESCWLKYDGHF